MKILQIHYTDSINLAGGGIVAMLRLHAGLKKANVESKILCKVKSPEFADSEAIPTSKGIRKLESLIGRFTIRLGLNDVHCINTYGIKKTKSYSEADILNFHGLQTAYFNFLALPYLTAEKPGVLTLHDMWPLTGHCAISYGCERWKIGCGHCPHLDATPPIQRDATRLEWKLKKWVYGRSNLAIVIAGSWLAQQAKDSMLNRFDIHHIPYGIDTEAYLPLETQECRSLLGIPPGKKVIMFAATKLNSFNKGVDLLVDALQRLPKSLRTEILLLTLGDRGHAIGDAAGVQTLNFGYVSSDRLKAIAYSAADIFVSPTRAENLPLVLQESMACGTPMVSFRVGGVPDLVRPGVTGYLAEPENAGDFSDGILRLLEHDTLRNKMSEQCRAIALKEYSLELQAQRYIDVFQNLLRK